MAEDREEGDETNKLGTTARSSLPPRKRLLTSLNQNTFASLNSSSSFVKFAKKTRSLPNLSDCHGCGTRIIAKGRKDKLRTLASDWRIVLLCKTCFRSVESAEICSYCFAKMSGEDFKCVECERRVHCGCISMHQRVAVQPDSFVCMDCWVPKFRLNRKLSGIGRSKVVPDSCSVRDCKDLVDLDRRQSLEILVKNADLKAKKAIAAATTAKQKVFEKAVVARRATEVARNALSLAVLATREENGEKDCGVVVDDKELAFRLHRAMNSSQRNLKSLCVTNTESLVSPRNWLCSDALLCRESNSGSRSVCGKREVCTDEKIFESLDKTEFNCISSIGNEKTIPRDNEREVKSERSVMEIPRKVAELNSFGNSDNNVNALGLPVKEEQGSCSNKVTNCSGDDNSMESISESNQNQNGSQHKVINSNRPDRCLKTYTKRHSSLKAILDRKAESLSENFVVESQGSAPVISRWQQNCSKASRTLSDGSYHSPSVPLQASACASGPSGHRL